MSGSGGPTLPRGRYGDAPRAANTRRRWRMLALVALAVVVIGTVAVLAYRNLGSAPIEANRLSFRQLPGNALELTIRVQRDEPQRPAVCVVRVRSIDGVETGRREVLVPPGESTLSTVVKSTKPPVTASVVGCSYNVPSYLSTQVRPME